MTVKQILDMTAADVKRLTTPELRKVLKSVVDANNKSIKRLQDRGIITQALISRAERVGAEDTASKDLRFRIPRGNKQTRNAMLSQLKDAIGYAQSETGSISRYEKSVARFEEKVPGISKYINGTDDRSKARGNRFWKMYNKFKEKNPQMAERGGTDKLLRAAVQTYNGRISLKTFTEQLKLKELEMYEADVEEDEEDFELPY